MRVMGLPAMSFVAFTDAPELVDHRDVARLEPEVPKAFGRLMAERGIRVHGRGLWLMSAAHSERDIDRTLEAAADSIREIAERTTVGPTLPDSQHGETMAGRERSAPETARMNVDENG